MTPITLKQTNKKPVHYLGNYENKINKFSTPLISLDDFKWVNIIYNMY